MRNSLMYKLSYYRFVSFFRCDTERGWGLMAVSYSFNELFGGQQSTDRVRNQKMPAVGPTLDTLDEAFTSGASLSAWL